jgi:hypothetical protein
VNKQQKQQEQSSPSPSDKNESDGDVLTLESHDNVQALGDNDRHKEEPFFIIPMGQSRSQEQRARSRRRKAINKEDEELENRGYNLIQTWEWSDNSGTFSS